LLAVRATLTKASIDIDLALNRLADKK